jgi:lipopolysaccharide export system permease protein
LTLLVYILRQVVMALVFAVTGMVVIAVPGMAIGAIQRLGGAFIGPILGYLPLEFVGLVPYFIPLGFLLAVVSTYGRLAADNEWTAMSAAGFSPLRLLLPGVVVALGLGAASWYLATEVAPPVSLQKKQYRRGALVQGLQTLAPGRTQIRIGDFFLTSRFREENEFREVIVNIPGDDDEPDQQLLAERLSYEIDETHVVVVAHGARLIHGHQDAEVGTVTLRRSLDSLFGTAGSGRIRWKYLTNPQLTAALADGTVKAKEVAAARYVWHSRNESAATCLMFLLLGAPTGLLLRRGTQLGALAAAVGYALVYFLLTLRFGRVMAENGIVPAWVGAWGTTLLGILAGAWLTWKVART